MRTPIAATMILLLALLLTACGAGPASTPTGTSGATAQAPDDTAPAARASAALDGLVLRYAPGGDNPARFCTPEWSVANQTAIDIPGLLIRIAWQDAAGNVLQPVGDYGTLFEGLAAGERRDRSLLGHPVDCRELRIVVGRYACRNADAVRVPCPGPLRVLTEGGIETDLAGVEEGPLPGFRGALD